MNLYKTIAYTCLTLPLVCAELAFAQDVGGQPLGAEGSGENIAYAGAGVVLFSEYLGSDDQDVSPLPYLSVNDYKGFDVFWYQLVLPFN